MGWGVVWCGRREWSECWGGWEYWCSGGSEEWDGSGYWGGWEEWDGRDWCEDWNWCDPWFRSE